MKLKNPGIFVSSASNYDRHLFYLSYLNLDVQHNGVITTMTNYTVVKSSAHPVKVITCLWIDKKIHNKINLGTTLSYILHGKNSETTSNISQPLNI